MDGANQGVLTNTVHLSNPVQSKEPKNLCCRVHLFPRMSTQVNHHKLLFAGNYYKCFYLFMPTTVLKNTITVRILQRRKQRHGATVKLGLRAHTLSRHTAQLLYLQVYTRETVYMATESQNDQIRTAKT